MDILIPMTSRYFPKSGLSWREKIQSECNAASLILANSWKHSSPEGKAKIVAATWPQRGLVLGRCRKPCESKHGVGGLWATGHLPRPKLNKHCLKCSGSTTAIGVTVGVTVKITSLPCSGPRILD